MPALLAAQTSAFVAVACLCGSALAQEEQQDDPPIDPYSEAGEAPPQAPSDNEAGKLPAYPVMPVESQAPSRAAERSGLMGGVALGIGTVGAGDDSDGTLNYTLSFGGYLTSSLALLVEFAGARAQDGDFRIDHSKQGVAALYWLDRRVWSKASVSSASYTTYVDDFMLSDFRGIAALAGLGWVFYSRGDFHLDARASLTIEAYKDARDKVTSTALQLGVQYF